MRAHERMHTDIHPLAHARAHTCARSHTRSKHARSRVLTVARRHAHTHTKEGALHTSTLAHKARLCGPLQALVSAEWSNCTLQQYCFAATVFLGQYWSLRDASCSGHWSCTHSTTDIDTLLWQRFVTRSALCAVDYSRAQQCATTIGARAVHSSVLQHCGKTLHCTALHCTALQERWCNSTSSATACGCSVRTRVPMP